MSLRVAHVITGLETGGAETLLVRLLGQTASRADSDVIALKSGGPVGDRLEELGIPVHGLGLRPVPHPFEFMALRNAIRATRADVVQTWLLHANVLGGLAARLGSSAPVVWGVHITAADRVTYGARAAAVQRVERRISRRVPSAIVACSESAARAMRGMGYPDDKVETIPNGVDVDHFRPDATDRIAVRRELGLADDDLVVGHFARFHPVKDHRSLLTAAAQVHERLPGARFVLCGAGVTREQPDLAAWAQPIGDAALMLGERDDVDRLHRALDILVQSSSEEALPLVLGEAMASGVPCVATAGGDSADLLGNTGRLVPPGDPSALAEAMIDALQLPPAERARLGAEARSRIEERYALDRMADRYVDLWLRVCGSKRS